MTCLDAPTFVVRVHHAIEWLSKHLGTLVHRQGFDAANHAVISTRIVALVEKLKLGLPAHGSLPRERLTEAEYLFYGKIIRVSSSQLSCWLVGDGRPVSGIAVGRHVD